MRIVEEFLRAIDARWPEPGTASVGAESPTLQIIGSTSIMLQTGYTRVTKDSDVLETADLPEYVRKRLVALGGRGTGLSARHRLYVDIVPRGIPFLPGNPSWVPLGELNGTLQHFQVEALSLVDVAVSKLYRFNSNDRADIGYLVDECVIDYAAFVEQFRSAVDSLKFEARAEELPRIVRNFHIIERDHFFEDETPIALPDWVE